MGGRSLFFNETNKKYSVISCHEWYLAVRGNLSFSNFKESHWSAKAKKKSLYTMVPVVSTAYLPYSKQYRLACTARSALAIEERTMHEQCWANNALEMTPLWLYCVTLAAASCTCRTGTRDFGWPFRWHDAHARPRPCGKAWSHRSTDCSQLAVLASTGFHETGRLSAGFYHFIRYITLGLDNKCILLFCHETIKSKIISDYSNH